MTEAISTAMALFPLLLLLPLASTQTTYYIKPTAESPCHHEDCLTLSEYAKETSRYMSSTTILQFLPGVHTLNNSVILLQNLDSLVLSGRDSFAQNVSIIQCEQDSGIIFINISKVEVIGLTFHYCGAHYSLTKYTHILNVSALPTLSALRIPHFHLVSCKFEDNYLPLFSDGSNVLLQDNRFEWNRKGAFLAGFSYILFKGYNVFKNNTNVGVDTVGIARVTYGGAIDVRHSRLVLEGSSHFISNYAHHGGAIAAYNTTIDIMLVSQMNHSGLEGRCEFSRNSAEEFGGALFSSYSLLTFSGSTLFHLNTAYDYGGAIYILDSELNVTGSIITSNNLRFLQVVVYMLLKAPSDFVDLNIFVLSFLVVPFI